MLATGETYFGVVPGNLLFLAVLLIACALFLRQAALLYRLMRLGGPDARWDDLGGRLRTVVRDVLGQGRLLKDPYSGIMHALIFWGFIVITVMTLTFWVGGVFPAAPTWIVDQNPVFLVLLETFEALVLVALGMAFLRRLLLHPNRLTYNTDALIILSLIALLMVSAFAAMASQIAYEPRANDVFAYLSSLLTPGFAGMAPANVLGVHVVAWWVHNLTLLFFLTYLPHSKHLHIVTAGFNTFFRSSKPRGQLSYVDIEKAFEQDPPKLGVGDIRDLSWKAILDTYTCTECGRCEAACPASRTGKPLSPKKLILDLKDYVMEHGPDLLHDGETNGHDKKPRLVGDAIIDEVLWDCTSCRACMQACPVFIEHVPKIIDMRRHLVMVENRFGADVQRLFDSLETQGNPWKFPAVDRGKWADGLGIPVLGQDVTVDQVDVVYWVGCAGSFDQRNQKIARTFAQLCLLAGVRVGILGAKETCTGDPARRAGNEYLFQMLAQQNVQTLNGLGVKKIVATCPHCFNTLKNEYPQLGGQYEAVHHTQFLAELLEQGRLKPEQVPERTLTYHDPCYIGRYNDLYDEPRQALQAVPGITVRDLKGGCREGAMCCGAGGARVFLDETRGRRINHLRFEQLQEVGAQGIATACPYCVIMLEDAASTKGLQNELPVLDVSEVLMSSLRQHESVPPAATAPEPDGVPPRTPPV